MAPKKYSRPTLSEKREGGGSHPFLCGRDLDHSKVLRRKEKPLKSETVSDKDPQTKGEVPQTSPKKVLYVEDNLADAWLFREVFRRYGRNEFQVNHEVSMRGALKKLSEEITDLVLLDLTLPESLGLSTLFRILLSCPHIPVVVLTGLRDEGTALQALRWGAQDYVIKDAVFDRDTLVRIARYSIERHRHLIQNY